MNTYYYAKTKRQYKYLIKRLNRLFENGEWQSLSETKQNKFKARLKNLFQKLDGAFSSSSLVKAMGTAALVLGLSVSGMAQSFQAPVTNPSGLTKTSDMGFPPSFADIDGDGDYDLFNTVYDSIGEAFDISYQENTGTSSSAIFGAPQINPFGISSDSITIKSVFGDLDNDGDIDLLRLAYYGNHIYYENTGTATAPQFTTQVLNPFGLTDFGDGIALGDFVDLDADGDLDLMIGNYYYSGEFYYYENTGTPSAAQFGAKQTNPFGLPSQGEIFIPEFSDIDGDGDQDLMISNEYGNFVFFKNTGSKSTPVFGPAQTNAFGLINIDSDVSPLTFVDLDGDMDEDIFVHGYSGNYYYYENGSGISIDENALNNQLSVFPNPTNGIVNISLGEDLGNAEIEITSISGQLVQAETIENTNNATLDVSTLKAGIYVLKLKADNRVGIKKLSIE